MKDGRGREERTKTARGVEFVGENEAGNDLGILSKGKRNRSSAGKGEDVGERLAEVGPE